MKGTTKMHVTDSSKPHSYKDRKVQDTTLGQMKDT